MRLYSRTILALGWACLPWALAPLAQGAEGKSADAAWTRWLNKPVLERRLLDGMEEMGAWRHQGAGALFWTRERNVEGEYALRLLVPTRPFKVAAPRMGAPFGEAIARREFNGENWTAYNRLSLSVYLHAPGLKSAGVLLRLHNQQIRRAIPKRQENDRQEDWERSQRQENDRQEDWERSQRQEDDWQEDWERSAAEHWVALGSERWERIVWEIPHLAREQIRALDVVFPQAGSDSGGTNVVVIDFDNLELEQVVPDIYEGWQVWPGRMGYCHLGYRTDSGKVIVTSGLEAEEFKVVNLADQQTQTLPIRTSVTPLGTFQLLDFSNVRSQGEYKIQAGGRTTFPFRIGEGVWHGVIGLLLKGFGSQRCGVEVPDGHGRCHLDWHIRRQREILLVHGGWHSSALEPDNLGMIAESVRAMAQLVRLYERSDPGLRDRLADEAAWGVDWLIKTQFKDGRRVQREPVCVWTDNQLGTKDDPKGVLTKDPRDLYLAAAAEAAFSRAFQPRGDLRAQTSLAAAKRDWETAHAQPWAGELALASAGADAAMELFHATGEQAYANAAVELAESIMGCQQESWTPGAPAMIGYFHSSTNRDGLPSHGSSLPLTVLQALCHTFPNHAKWMDWYFTVVLHSEFLRTRARENAPWFLIPIFHSEADGNSVATKEESHRFAHGPSEEEGQLPRLLEQAKELASAAHLRRDQALLRLAECQLQWIAGQNPFSQTLLFGAGHDCPPVYSPLLGEVLGAVPEGMRSKHGRDEPYWPASTTLAFKGMSLLAAARWLSVLQDLDGGAAVTGQYDPNETDFRELTDTVSGFRYPIPQPEKGKPFSLSLPAGRYRAGPAAAELSWVLFPGRTLELNLLAPLAFTVSLGLEQAGVVQLTVNVSGRGKHRFQVRGANLDINEPEREISFGVLGIRSLTWNARVQNPMKPWVAVVIPDGDLARRKELYGTNRPSSP